MIYPAFFQSHLMDNFPFFPRKILVLRFTSWGLKIPICISASLYMQYNPSAEENSKFWLFPMEHHFTKYKHVAVYFLNPKTHILYDFWVQNFPMKTQSNQVFNTTLCKVYFITYLTTWSNILVTVFTRIYFRKGFIRSLSWGAEIQNNQCLKWIKCLVSLRKW